jgi:hypothetical protein
MSARGAIVAFPEGVRRRERDAKPTAAPVAGSDIYLFGARHGCLPALESGAAHGQP